MPWNWKRRTNKQLALLALVATLASTVIASTAALSVAVVEGIYARNLARESARREYRQKLVAPLITYAEERLVFIQRVSKSLVETGELHEPLRADFIGMLAEWDEEQARRSPLVTLTPAINAATSEFFTLIHKHTELAHEMSTHSGAGPMPEYSKRVDASFSNAASAMNLLRAACEDYMFE